MPLLSPLVDGSRSLELPEGSFTPPFRSEYDLQPSHKGWGRVRRWWRHSVLGEPPVPQPPSLYLTLIPLNDARLKPQKRWLLIPLMGVLFAPQGILLLAAIAATFLCVPRGFAAGEIETTLDRMSWNNTKGTYQLNLLAHVPIRNPNFFQGKVSGNLRVYFFDTEAGAREIAPTKIPARANPAVVEVTLDASNLPNKYARTILSECNTFPKRLIFFLKGSLTMEDMLQKVTSHIDSSFMIDCQNGGKVPQALPFEGRLEGKAGAPPGGSPEGWLTPPAPRELRPFGGLRAALPPRGSLERV